MHMKLVWCDVGNEGTPVRVMTGRETGDSAAHAIPQAGPRCLGPNMIRAHLGCAGHTLDVERAPMCEGLRHSAGPLCAWHSVVPKCPHRGLTVARWGYGCTGYCV